MVRGPPTLPSMRTPAEMVEEVRRVLAAEPHLRWGYVFGSVARGTTTYRDVDVAIMPAPTMPPGILPFGQIVARLEATLGTKVDLVDLSAAELPFVGPMLCERIVVLDRERDARHVWEAETTVRWIDFRPSYEEALRVRTLAMQRRVLEAR